MAVLLLPLGREGSVLASSILQGFSASIRMGGWELVTALWVGDELLQLLGAGGR